jgi:hypothetical protein
VPLALRMRKLVVTGALFALLVAFLYQGALPCWFARLTHHPCPACGSTRAVVCLLHGDLAGMLRYNPLGPVAAVVVGVAAVHALALVFVDGDFRRVGEGPFGRAVKRALLVVLALEIALWITRFFGAFGGPVPV